MNRIVRDHYPVENLPEDLREGFASDAEVRVTVEPIEIDYERETGAILSILEGRGRVLSLEDIFARRQPTFTSIADIMAHVRAMRDE